MVGWLAFLDKADLITLKSWSKRKLTVFYDKSFKLCCLYIPNKTLKAIIYYWGSVLYIEVYMKSMLNIMNEIIQSHKVFSLSKKNIIIKQGTG